MSDRIEYICILDMNGKPMMSSKRRRHINKLLDTGKARIVCEKPFTVQLKYDTPGKTQKIIFSVDPGRTNIGGCIVELYKFFELCGEISNRCY